MDISFETPDFSNLNQLMEKESQKNIDGQNNPRVKELLKEIKLSKDNYEIIQLCARVHELDPDNFKIFVDQAIAFHNLKQYEKANESFQIAIVAATKIDHDLKKMEKSMQDGEIRCKREISYEREISYDRNGYDRNGYDRNDHDGTPGFVFTMYAIFLMSQNDLEVALEYCDKAIEMQKNHIKGLSLQVKGMILCEVGEYQKALECVDESLDMRYDDDVKKTRDRIIKKQNQFK